jgi:hypothetical protein
MSSLQGTKQYLSRRGNLLVAEPAQTSMKSSAKGSSLQGNKSTAADG